MASEIVKKENATDIINKHLNNYPNLKIFLEILLADVEVETKQVGRKFQYHPSVLKNKLTSYYGNIIILFIQKVLSEQFSIKSEDDLTEHVLNNAGIYFTSQVKSRILPKDIEKHYEIFKDPKKQAMDILESIKKIALSRNLYFHDRLPGAEVGMDNTNLAEIVKYFKQLPYSCAEVKSDVGCNYFDGSADIIFDRKDLYEIKTSTFSSLSRSDQNISKKNFYKLVLYGFGYYKKTGRIIKCFKIFNTLLGQEHTVRINDVDMKHFEQVLQKDTYKR